MFVVYHRNLPLWRNDESQPPLQRNIPGSEVTITGPKVGNHSTMLLLLWENEK